MISFIEKLKESVGVEDEELKEQKPRKKKEALKSDKSSSAVKKLKVEKENGDGSAFAPSAALRATADKKDWLESDGELAVDVLQTNGDIVIQSVIAGVKPDDLDISIEKDLVIIKGARKSEFREEKKNYFHQECFWGTFSRQILLPEEVDQNRAAASFKDGVLTLKLPKLSKEKVKKIRLTS